MKITDYVQFLLMMIPTWLLLGAVALTLTFPGRIEMEQPAVEAASPAEGPLGDALGNQQPVIEVGEFASVRTTVAE